MNDNSSHLLNISKLTETLASKLPSFEGPWSYTKTSFGQSNPTFILKGKSNNLVLRRKPDGQLLKSAHMIEREYEVMESLYNIIYKNSKPESLLDDLINHPHEIDVEFKKI